MKILKLVKVKLLNNKKTIVLFEYLRIAEVVAPMCSVKRVFLKISQNSQENTCTRVSFLKRLQVEAWKIIK